MANVEIGNLYDINKDLVERKEKKLSPTKIREGIEDIKIFMSKTNNKYYMLLCRERNDYTVFKTNQTIYGNEYNAKVLVEEVLLNRGMIKGIDATEDNLAFEIWVSIDNESFCYFFFPCDGCVIDEVD